MAGSAHAFAARAFEENMTKLSVNVNKVATLRNTRAIGMPSVVHASKLCLDAGAQGITIHPRPDQRHIRPADVCELAELLKSYPDAEYNIEGNPFHGYVEYAKSARPAQCTLVPDAPGAFTSNQGWNIQRDFERLKPIIQTLKSHGCRVSLFMDPNPEALNDIPKLGADRIELYTEPFAAAFARGDKHAAQSYAQTARRAVELGLGVNAGHDLNLANLAFFLKEVPGVQEVSIGHALIADALELGLAETVRRYLACCASSGH
jgi:pyridoxine 5-phosphate synthase